MADSAWQRALNQRLALSTAIKSGAYLNDVEKYGGLVSNNDNYMYEYTPDVNRIWQEDYAPVVSEAAAAGRTENQNTLERELAKLRMRMGYNQSAGAGTGGWWNLARSNMLNAGAQKQMDINDAWRRWQAQQHLGFLNTKDQQQFQSTMLAKQDYYRQEALKLQAELNDPTWWETLGGIVGYAGALWGWAGFPMPNFGGGALLNNLSEPGTTKMPITGLELW